MAYEVYGPIVQNQINTKKKEHLDSDDALYHGGAANFVIVTTIPTGDEYPPAGTVFLYRKNDGNWYEMDEAGTETQINGGGGGGGSTLALARNTAVFDITSNATLTDMLTLPVSANTVYQVQGFLPGITGGVGSDFALTIPAGAAFMGSYELVTANGYSVEWDGVTEVPTGTTFWGQGVGQAVAFKGILVVAGTAGNLVLQVAQNVSSPTTTEVPVNAYLSAIDS